jgi:serine protease Do
MNRRLPRLGLLLALAALALGVGAGGERDPQIGQAFQVPYRLTDTNHFLVRVRINGKGPFNFLVDTGAPALYIATATARKIGLEPAKDSFWTAVDRLEFEGGARLSGLKARIEDPFQLVGMNALGLPGASIDGILGFTVLARFRLELDPTRDRMTWTRLDYEPRDPPVPDRKAGEGPPAEMQAMNLLGPVAKFAAALVGKQPEEALHPRGSLGLELGEAAEGGLKVVRALPGSPAAKAGIESGDRLVRLRDRDVATVKAARDAVAEVRPGDQVPLAIRRGRETRELTLTATEGF